MWGNSAVRAFVLSGLLALGLSAIACSASGTSTSKKDAGAFEDEFGGDFSDEFDRFPKGPGVPSTVVEDASALAPPAARQADGGVPSGGRGTQPGDAGTAKPCGPLAPGDLAIVEMMISSVTGQGDKGEWVEVQNTRDCTLTVSGLAFESPRGSATDRAEVTETLVLAPRSTFVVGGPNVTIPGKLFRWTGSDVLKNSGDTARLVTTSAVIDEVTYPGYAFTTGVSLSFPTACSWTDRTSWDRWSASFKEWSPGFKGTPNADNTDVACY
jgi:hypothetical protein